MITTSKIDQQYSDWLPFIQSLSERVGDKLKKYCITNNYIFDERIKTLESLAEKVESGRYGQWEDLDDLYACTIAVPLIENEDEVVEFVQNSFDIVNTKIRGRGVKPPDAFRFDSTRIIAKLKTTTGEADRVFELKFEIQVKSLFEYAWSKTTHALAYKTSLVDWRRFRLAAHLKAATEQLDFLLVGFDSAASLIDDGYWPDLQDKSRIRDTLSKILDSGAIPGEAAPKDWSRFAENLYAAFQAFEGNRASGRSSRKLESLDQMLGIIGEYFDNLEPSKYPMSISLFQLCVAVIASSGKYGGSRTDYHLPITQEMIDLFPSAGFPCAEFRFQNSVDGETEEH